MKKAQRMAAAWIIERCLHRQDLPMRELRPHILPVHWRSDRVLDYMRCLFWNSDLWTPFETLASINRQKPQGIFILNEAPRLIYGDATHLIAWYVKDLRIHREKPDQVVMECTASPGQHFDANTRVLQNLGEPKKRIFVWNESPIA